MLTIEPGPRGLDLFHTFLHRAKLEHDDNVRFTGSGKASLRMIFGYLQKSGVLEHKMAPILTPPWLGTWVYSALLPYGFPVLDSTEARVVLVYHQYGFPQNLSRVLDIAASRRLMVIEDCAHACESFYKGRRVGTFGEFALFSYSKFVFCYALGGIAGGDQDFHAYLEENIGSSGLLRFVVSAIKLFDETNIHLDRPIAGKMTNGLTNMAYARYGDQTAPGMRAISLWLSKKKDEMEQRRKNYALLRNETGKWGLCDHLEEDGIVPYAVPLAVSSGKAVALVTQLRQAGIQSGIRHFDYARCIFEPDYHECVLVPIHSQMTGKGMDILLSCLQQVL
jgi:hypothetical protein